MKIRDIRYFFKDCKTGIKNLIIWLPVIWKDRWWDPWFFYVVLHKKLSLMEKNIRQYGNHVGSEKDADKIKRCIYILNRLIKDEYHEIASKNYYKKWGESEFEFIDTDDPEYSELKITYPFVKTEADEKRQKYELTQLVKKEEDLINQDLEILFELLRKNIRSWWD